MSEDLVKRLRRTPTTPMKEDAADEIVRLRRLLMPFAPIGEDLDGENETPLTFTMTLPRGWFREIRKELLRYGTLNLDQKGPVK